MLHQHLKVTKLNVSSVWHKFIETLRKGFYYQKNIHVIFKKLKVMVNNYEKDCRAHNSKIMYFLNYELP